jgi:hypothetical protein
MQIGSSYRWAYCARSRGSSTAGSSTVVTPTVGVPAGVDLDGDVVAHRHLAGEVDLLGGQFAGTDHPVLGDLGYEGEADTTTVAIKKPQGGELTEDQKTHNGKRAVGERGNLLLKTTFKGSAQRQPVSLEDRLDRRSGLGPPAHRSRPTT